MEDKERTEQTQGKSRRNPKESANFLSSLCFCWTFPLFLKSLKTELTEDDLYEPLKVHESKRVGNVLEKAWLKEANRSRHPSLWRVLTKVYGKKVLLFGCVLIMQDVIIRMAQPLLIGRLLAYYSPNQTTTTKNQAYLYAGGIILVSLTSVLITHSYFFGVQHLGMRIRVSCCSLIYRKALRLSKSAMVETTVGQMVNLLSNDVNRFDYLILHIHHLVLAPIQTFVVLYLLYISLNSAGMVGVGLLFTFIPLQLYMGRLTSSYRFKTALKTDQRVRLMHEIISGIQVIKMYTWEKPFTKFVEMARKMEIQHIRATSYLRAINGSFGIFLNRTAVYLCVLAYVLMGNNLNAEYVYVVTSFYGMLRQALTMFMPRAITMIAESNVSVKRIQKFLMLDELISDRMLIAEQAISNGKKFKTAKIIQTMDSLREKNVGIYIEDGCVKWDKTLPYYTLSNISFNVAQGQLVAIVGPVGSGKTTLLNVILKELILQKGSLDVEGSISYASQEPWLFAGSIRQNILFGEEMDWLKYQEVLKVCALQRDLALFPYADRTIVGERGVMLSGGQKARINLARAVYKNADIYLLDDPLSAVDTHVGKQLFDECILDFLRNKCTILVTHQIQYLNKVPRIYLMENGRISASGTYAELQNSHGEFMHLLEEKREVDEVEEVDDTREKAPSMVDLKSVALPDEVKEHGSIGRVSRRIYSKYLLAGGRAYQTFLVVSLFVLAQIGASGTDYFLTFWVNLEQWKAENAENATESNKTLTDEYSYSIFNSQNCIYIYTTFIAFIILVTLTRSLNFFRFCMKASTNLHNDMFSNIVYTTMRFFNTNPSGRILNRFSKDMGSIDETLPQSIIDTMQVGLNVLAITILLSVINVWIIIPTVIIFIVFYCYKVVFLKTTRTLKRIEGRTRSPVFSHLTASLQGLTTIRAFKAEAVLESEFDRHQDLHSSAYYLFHGCSRTFAFWLDINCLGYVSLVIFSLLFIGTETYGGNVGLVITQSITLTGMLQWGMRQWSELENQMTSVERVVEYTELEPELDDENKKPPENWPDKGRIAFKSVYLQYSLENPMVLKNLSFEVEPREKIGIVGRTGAGKSSLIFALFRLVQIKGDIVIDGVNTQHISLRSLRSKISIIPQEPVLFSGSLRRNLDPFDEFEDSELWNALEEVELKTPVSSLPSGLQSKVSEGGSNFSVGQRQLLCLARAIVRSNRILVLDEATANVDPQTDELIQSTIRRKFRECTVLTIAHRLHTVMDSDKILVMDAGQAVEFGPPHQLLQNPDGVFYSLVKQTGKGMAENLMKIAEENHHQRI